MGKSAYNFRVYGHGEKVVLFLTKTFNTEILLIYGLLLFFSTDIPDTPAKK